MRSMVLPWFYDWGGCHSTGLQVQADPGPNLVLKTYVIESKCVFPTPVKCGQTDL